MKINHSKITVYFSGKQYDLRRLMKKTKDKRIRIIRLYGIYWRYRIKN